MVNADDNSPLGGAISRAAAGCHGIHQRELAGESVRKMFAVSHIPLLRDGQTEFTDEFRESGVLAAEVKRDLPDIVNTCQENQRGSRLGRVTVPDQRQEPTVMLRQVVVEEQPRDIGGIHQVLAHGQPGRRIRFAALGPEGKRQLRESGPGQVRLWIRKRRRFQVLGVGERTPRARTCHFISSLPWEN